jgi:predicted ATPase/DNA-binding CsgD family transcriptional regulator
VTDLLLPEPLSEREIEILKCLAEGLSNRGIANRLHLAYQTVKGYNSEIYSKLGVKNRDEAVELAKVLGLLKADSDVIQPGSKHNLPESVTGFVGRQQEIHDLLQLLGVDDNRLITILAPGGMGKTRLSLEVARTQIGRFADGVYFVPLAPLSSPGDIVTTIAENIGLVFHGEHSPTQQLVNFLKAREMLLVLDNMEHLLDGVDLISDILQSTPGTRIMVTSRERLKLHGETVYNLRGLGFPAWETPNDALAYDAVKLFMQSAKHVRADFELHTMDLGFLARICRLTAGMPLGIELAAGWVEVLSLEKIANEIQRGIDILETDLSDVPKRHRSLRAAFEQTWSRLTSDEQAVFARLSVFQGGFTLASAEVVASATLWHLRKLAQKSLVQIETDQRYTIHELLRQFGQGKLAELAELPAIQAKHAQYFADFMVAREPESKTDQQLEAFQRIDAEFENVRVAWHHFVKTGIWEQLPKFLHSLYSYASLGSHAHELVGLLEPAVAKLRALPVTAEHEFILGQLLAVYGKEVMNIGFPKRAVELCNEAVELLRQHGRPEDLMVALYHQQEALMFADQYERASLTLEEALPLAQTLGDIYFEAHFLRKYVSVELYYQQDYQQAIRYAERALALFNRLNLYPDLALLFLLMGEAYVFQEQYEQAQAYFERSLPIAKQYNKAPVISPACFFLGRIAIVQGDLVLARHYLYEALFILWNTGHYWLLAQPLPYVTLLFLKQQAFHRAVEVLACVDPRLIFWRDNDPLIHNLRAELEAQLDAESFAAAWKRGQARDLKAFVLELLAELAEE